MQSFTLPASYWALKTMGRSPPPSQLTADLRERNSDSNNATVLIYIGWFLSAFNYFSYLLSSTPIFLSCFPTSCLPYVYQLFPPPHCSSPYVKRSYLKACCKPSLYFRNAGGLISYHIADIWANTLQSLAIWVIIIINHNFCSCVRSRGVEVVGVIFWIITCLSSQMFSCRLLFVLLHRQ